MSDTTTITPEERAEIRTPSDKWDALWYPHDRCHNMMLRLINALEQAEARAEQADANVARLTKERDWLANQLDCPSEFTNCAVDCAECRKEAASRAVDAGEG